MCEVFCIIVCIYFILFTTEGTDDPDGAPVDEEEEDDELAAEAMVVRTGHERRETPPPIEPLYELNPDGSLPGTSPYTL